MTREQLRDSAVGWITVGVIFLLLAAIGAVVIGIAATPETVHSEGVVETRGEVGIAIGAGVFVGSLVAVLPFFAIARLMKGIAELLPPGDNEDEDE